MMMVMEDWDVEMGQVGRIGPAKTEPTDLARKLHLESVTGKKIRNVKQARGVAKAADINRCGVSSSLLGVSPVFAASSCTEAGNGRRL